MARNLADYIKEKSGRDYQALPEDEIKYWRDEYMGISIKDLHKLTPEEAYFRGFSEGREQGNDEGKAVMVSALLNVKDEMIDGIRYINKLELNKVLISRGGEI